MRQPRDWNQLINEWENSDLSVETICQDHQLSVSTFYKHKRQLKENAQCVFAPVVIQRNDTISFIVNGLHITCDPDDVASILGAIK